MEQGKEMVAVSAWGDLIVDTVNVAIELPDRVLNIPMRVLTLSEWVEVENELVRPTPPPNGATPQGPTYNYKDPTYIRQINQWLVDVANRRVLKALKLNVPGETPAEKLAAIEGLGVIVSNGLRNAVSMMGEMGKARLEGRAATFQSTGSADAASQPAAGTDATSVAKSKA